MFDNISFFSPLSSNRRLSSIYIGFSGILVNNFTYTENFIQFKLPQIPTNVGTFDILVQNEAGYGTISSSTNPAITGCIDVFHTY